MKELGIVVFSKFNWNRSNFAFRGTIFSCGLTQISTAVLLQSIYSSRMLYVGMT